MIRLPKLLDGHVLSYINISHKSDIFELSSLRKRVNAIFEVSMIWSHTKPLN